MAAKKNFRSENPAMYFIGQQGAAEPVPTGKPVPGRSTPSVRQQDTPPVKLNPLYIETKSRRLSLLMQPSLHDKIKGIARARGVSVNDTIHQILQNYIDGQGAE